jgi:hypothetical protein
MMPNVEAGRLLTGGEACAVVRAAACTTISYLHQQTVTTVCVDEAVLRRWIDEPIATLQQLQPSLSSATRYQHQLRCLQQELRSALAGRTVGLTWVHGDYTPGNILMEPESYTITGVLDWELAAPDDLPPLDLVQFFVATRVIRHQCEYGDVIRTLLTTAGWEPQEILLLRMAQGALPGERLGERELALLCWLRHVVANLTKSERYTHHWWWKVRNLEAVLLAL